MKLVVQSIYVWDFTNEHLWCDHALHTHLTLSFPRVINIKFLLHPHQKYYITQYEELGFSQLTQMKDDYTTNSHYPQLYSSLYKVGRMYFLNFSFKRRVFTGAQPVTKWSELHEPFRCNFAIFFSKPFTLQYKLKAWISFALQFQTFRLVM